MSGSKKQSGRRILIASLFFLFLSFNLKAQKSQDTLYREHSPKKATYLALIPGAGQIYNKKYWKLPIIYAAFGTVTYFEVKNHKEYIKYKEAYKCKIDLGDACENELANKYPAEDLKYIRNYYRRNYQLMFIIGGAVYILQIVDAVVDAHLYYWDVSKDISLRIDPVINVVPQAKSREIVPYGGEPVMNGLKLSVKF